MVLKKMAALAADRLNRQKEGGAEQAKDEAIDGLQSEVVNLQHKVEQLTLENEQLRIQWSDRRTDTGDVQKLISQVEKYQAMLQDQGEMVTQCGQAFEQEKVGHDQQAKYEQQAEDMHRLVSMLEKENADLKAEAEAVFGPLEQKLKELTDQNSRYEKKLRQCKDENKDLKQQLAMIEAEVEDMTARGLQSSSKTEAKVGQVKAKLMARYEQQLEERDNEIRVLLNQNRNMETDLRHLERKLKSGEATWSPSDSIRTDQLTDRISSPADRDSGKPRWHASMQQASMYNTLGPCGPTWSTKGKNTGQFVALADHLRTRNAASPLLDVTDILNRPSDDNSAAIDKFKQVL